MEKYLTSEVIWKYKLKQLRATVSLIEIAKNFKSNKTPQRRQSLVFNLLHLQHLEQCLACGCCSINTP